MSRVWQRGQAWATRAVFRSKCELSLCGRVEWALTLDLTPRAQSQRVTDLSSMRPQLHVHPSSRQRQKKHTPEMSQLIRSILKEFTGLPKEMLKHDSEGVCRISATLRSVIYVDHCILQTLVPFSNYDHERASRFRMRFFVHMILCPSCSAVNSKEVGVQIKFHIGSCQEM